MFNQLMSLAAESGIWAALFCILFIYQLRDSRSREARYCDTIKKLTLSLGDLNAVKNDCEVIKKTVAVVKETVASVKNDCQDILQDCAVIKSGGACKYKERAKPLTRKNQENEKASCECKKDS